MKTKPLSDVERAALRRLWDEHNISGMRRMGFDGALGRVGTSLTKRGITRNLGRHIYANNRPEMGERPDAYVKFELTPFGKSLASQLFYPAKKMNMSASR